VTTLNSTPSAVIGNTESNTESNTDQSLYDANFALLSEEEKSDWLANGMQDGASIRCILSSDVSAYPKNPSYPSSQELKHHEEFLKRQAEKQNQPKDQPQKQERQAAASASSMTGLDKEQQQEQPQRPSAAQTDQETIGAHFSDEDILDRLTEGELDVEEYHCTDGFVDWALLSDCALAAVDAKKERPYVGLVTNAALMRDTMKRLKKRHNLNVPEPWIPIMDAMQGRTPEMKAEKERKKREAEMQGKHAPVFSNEELEMLRERARISGREPCQEWNIKHTAQVVIMRTPEDRLSLGFNTLAPCTVTGIDAQGQTGKPVWHKARE
jgi:hypothetical protein